MVASPNVRSFFQQCPEKLVRSCWSLVNFERLYLISCTTCKYAYIYIQMGRVTCSTTPIQLFARHLIFSILIHVPDFARGYRYFTCLK